MCVEVTRIFLNGPIRHMNTNNSAPKSARNKKVSAKRSIAVTLIAEVLPNEVPTWAPSPPLETEQPHRKLARLNGEQVRVTEQIRIHSKAWAERNLRSQSVRERVTTPEITAYKNEHRELASRLLDIQTQIGACNKLIREHKARRAGNAKRDDKPNFVSKKNCPLKSHPQWDCYFRVAAENSLAPAMLKQIEADAKSLLAHALETGVDT